MEYTQGSIGRVFVARLHDGESIYDAVHQIASRERVSCAAVMAVGGIRSGKVVTGPESPTGEVIPHFEEFDDARELVGVGTLFPKDGEPSLHFHAGIGRRDTALVGCPRGGMSAFLVLEVVVIELVGASAERVMDADLGFHVLAVSSGDDRRR